MSTAFVRLVLGIAVAIVVYFSFIRDVLTPAAGSAVELLVLGLLVLILLGVFFGVIVQLLRTAMFKERTPGIRKLGEKVVLLLIVFSFIAAVVSGSQLKAHTPPILDENGKPLAGSITALEKVVLGGVEQWLIIRGHDMNKPVLLFLSGGPGSSEAGRVLRFNSELEKHFVVVIWEQRGCGKSYPSLHPTDKLTVDQYVADIVELTEMLKERFKEEKIYVMGHSWGTIIGVRAAQAHPNLFHAYIGTAQMVNVQETDQIIYRKMLEYAERVGDSRYLASLQKQGEPPYYGKNPIVPYVNVLQREYAVFETVASTNEVYRRDGDVLLLMLKQPEYGWIDRINNLRGLKDTFNIVYPQLQEFDFRSDATHFDLPVYLISGRNDTNAPAWLSEDYFNLIDAPYKELIYFEDSGHGMIWQEADKCLDVLVNRVLAETYPTEL